VTGPTDGVSPTGDAHRDWAGRADLLTRLGRFDQAEQAARRGLAADPGDAAAHSELAWALFGSGRLAEALDAVDAALRSAPDNGYAHRLRSILLNRLGREAESLAAARRAADLFPDRPLVLITLGEAERRAGAPEEAGRLARDALRLDPHRHEAHFLLANLALDAGRLDDAERAARAVLAAEPDDRAGHHLLGRVLERRERPREALAAYATAGWVLPPEAGEIGRDAITAAARTATSRLARKRRATHLTLPVTLLVLVLLGMVWLAGSAGLLRADGPPDRLSRLLVVVPLILVPLGLLVRQAVVVLTDERRALPPPVRAELGAERATGRVRLLRRVALALLRATAAVCLTAVAFAASLALSGLTEHVTGPLGAVLVVTWVLPVAVMVVGLSAIVRTLTGGPLLPPWSAPLWRRLRAGPTTARSGNRPHRDAPVADR
jgi:Flp pilus assembly protein TadD